MDVEGTLEYWVGKALARAGDTRRSAALAAILEKKARVDSPTDRVALAALRGEVLLARLRPAEAMPHLDAAWVVDSNHPVLIESRAHVAEAAGNLALATTLYGRLAAGGWFGSEGQFAWQIAPYRLAHLYERANKPTDAREAYERFLMNVPKPDSGLGAVADARARLRLLATPR
jgi:tetratricopeptide (TPR) repeat protein